MLRPEDFDFPISYDFSRFLNERHDWGLNIPPIDERPYHQRDNIVSLDDGSSQTERLVLTELGEKIVELEKQLNSLTNIPNQQRPVSTHSPRRKGVEF